MYRYLYIVLFVNPIDKSNNVISLKTNLNLLIYWSWELRSTRPHFKVINFCSLIVKFKKYNHSIDPSVISLWVRHTLTPACVVSVLYTYDKDKTCLRSLSRTHNFGFRVKIPIIKLNCDNISNGGKLLRFFHFTL